MSKNAVYIIIIVVCLLGAGFVAYKYIFSGGSGGISGIPEGQMVWVKCNNPDCKAEYQMSKRKYYEEVEKRFNPLVQTTPAITCEKCGQESLYEAIKCSNPECGIIFFKGVVRGDIEDRCPECGHSAIEDSRKARLAERGQ
jgi:hypothetical protein